MPSPTATQTRPSSQAQPMDTLENEIVRTAELLSAGRPSMLEPAEEVLRSLCQVALGIGFRQGRAAVRTIEGAQS